MAKRVTIYSMADSRCPKGKMYKVDGPAIKEGLLKGRITQNDTWDCDEQKLIAKLKSKGVEI
jgi:hypothetical protein